MHSCALHNFDILRHILIIFGDKEDDSGHVTCKRDNSHYFRYVIISTEAKSCAGHNTQIIIDNLIITDRD